MRKNLLAALAASVLCASSAFAVTYVVPKDEILIERADAIVIATALHSEVLDSQERGIETVTVFSLEDTLKSDGAIAGDFDVRIPGGVIEQRGKRSRFKVIPGTPKFADGERLLLFLRRVGDNEYATTDLALGLFGFATDDLGRHVVVRAETEIIGWGPDGTVHREPHRDADAFLAFIRERAKGRPAATNYVIDPRPLVSDSRSLRATTMRTSPLRPTTETCSGCTVTQYTLPTTTETSQGFRWKTFPINWNRGSTESNATSNGDGAINSAFSQWNAPSSAGYIHSTTTSNPNGILDSPDSINNIVFEKDLTSLGAAAYSCTHGGVLGLGGIQSANSDSTNKVNGETFFANTEGDVSMNQGLNTCLGGGQLSQGDFTSAVTHEVGHTLGLRHADKSRDDSQPCTNLPAYDCGSSAIMTASVTTGLNGVLAAWDTRAITALYPPTSFAAPTGVTATASSTNHVTISWDAVSGVLNNVTQYSVYRTSDNSAYSVVCTATAPTVTCEDTTAAAGTAYLYKVRAGTAGTLSSADLATTVIFTDPTLTGGTTPPKTAHITELRTAVDAVRKLANGGVANPFSYTDSTLTGGTTPIKKVHITDLRTALDAARSTLALTALSYTDPTITVNSTAVKAVHITELRNGVK
ncbi:MAG TPA: hypothetical protein VGJ81_04445 [Thermoanaerobaculia bacterium]|jgi:hypothetical protein